MNHLAK